MFVINNGWIKYKGRKILISTSQQNDSFMVLAQCEGYATIVVEERQWQPSDAVLGIQAIDKVKLAAAIKRFK